MNPKYRLIPIASCLLAVSTMLTWPLILGSEAIGDLTKGCVVFGTMGLWLLYGTRTWWDTCPTCGRRCLFERFAILKGNGFFCLPIVLYAQHGICQCGHVFHAEQVN